MPKEMASRGHYATATKEVLSGAPCIEDEVPGIAVKQQAHDITTGIATASTIAVGEDFFIIAKGKVEVDVLAGAVVGDDVHITVADNTLTETSAVGTRRYGRVVEIAGERGTPTGKMRVDLDLKHND